MKKELLAFPKKGRETGSWRTQKPVIDLSKCIGCTTCFLNCPDGCISMQLIEGKKKAVIDYSFCKGCLICLTVCPVKAISLTEEKK